MTVVVDASVVVAALVDNGPDGQWADDIILSGPLAAPHLLPVEVANVLRRAAGTGDISGDVATLAHGDLGDVRLDLYDYESCAARVWELRENLSAYDAWYVALAELLEAPLASLDLRLARSAGPQCEFLTRDAAPRGS